MNWEGIVKELKLCGKWIENELKVYNWKYMKTLKLKHNWNSKIDNKLWSHAKNQIKEDDSFGYKEIKIKMMDILK